MGDEGVLSAIVNGPEPLDLMVGGLSGQEHLDWLEQGFELLKIGDEVTICIVETDQIDEPVGRSDSRTRAEEEREVKDYLEQARSLLPVPLQESENASIALFDQRFAENHFMGAMDVLELLGDLNSASADFWWALSRAAHDQTAYEDRDRYVKKAKAIKAEPDPDQQ
ncbi:MAG: hypothetical protein KY445_11390 [Armatimonadetes bacterium]|nr:hypothetical protein [Armatimonadota bacterium]